MAKQSDDQPARKPDPAHCERAKNLWNDVRETRSDANALAGDAREIFKGLGFSPEAIGMYKKLSDLGNNRGPAVLAELVMLLDADGGFDLRNLQPDLFATEQVKKTTKGKRGGKGKSPDAALEAARKHLGVDEMQTLN